MKAAVYLRISAGRADREPDLERQRAGCLRLAGALGADVVAVYSDDGADGPAPGPDRRPAYRRLLADAGARRFGTVIAYTSGRLAQRPAEYEDLIDLAQRHGIRFAYVLPAAAEAGSALAPIVGAAGTFRRLAGELAPELRGLLADAGPAIEPFAEGVAGFVRNAMPGVRALVRQSAPAVTELSRALPAWGHATGAFLGGVAPGAPGTAALVTDVVGLATTHARFWGDVVGRLADRYLALRGLADDAGAAFAALPERARIVVVGAFDQTTTAVGVGIGAALRSHASGALPGVVRQGLAGTANAANSAASALVGAAMGVAAGVPVRLGRAVGGLGGPVRYAGARLRAEGRELAGGVAGGAESAAGFTLAAVERATGNILAGVRSGLAPPAAVGAVALPGGIAVNDLRINLYAPGELSDPATVDRVAAGVHEALNRFRREYA
ncbi:recombinase family protein [Planosporangium thailandense]|uniref:Recombinase family protein n=1 Tax=Planosporangium thailandense TaxID=765197 RepID=A0ABX0XY51_9ACTN|nr:recombinase family protein [Planosporangium thailandense]NJC70963.1 recombinase family protein [Planosporangium thailandense]